MTTEPAHGVTSSATNSPALGGAILFREGLGVDRREGDGVARLQQEGRIAMQLVGPRRVRPSRCPAARAGQALHAGLDAADRDGAARVSEPRLLAPGQVQGAVQAAEIGPAGREADHRRRDSRWRRGARTIWSGVVWSAFATSSRIDAVLAAIGDGNSPAPRSGFRSAAPWRRARAVARRAHRSRSARGRNAPAATDRSARSR